MINLAATTSCQSCLKFCWKLIHYDITNKNIFNTGQSIYHFCDKGITNWYELALAIRKYALDYSLIKNPAIIKPINTFEYNSFAKRPKFSLLDCQETVEK